MSGLPGAHGLPGATGPKVTLKHGTSKAVSQGQMSGTKPRDAEEIQRVRAQVQSANHVNRDLLLCERSGGFLARAIPRCPELGQGLSLHRPLFKNKSDPAFRWFYWVVKVVKAGSAPRNSLMVD